MDVSLFSRDGRDICNQAMIELKVELSDAHL